MKRPYSSLESSGHTPNSKNGNSQSQKSTAQHLPSDWQQHRDLNPVQRTFNLDFNYWMAAQRLDMKGVIEIVQSIVAGEKARSTGSVIDPADIAIVTISNIDHEALGDSLSLCPYLSSCSSMPTLFVEKADLPNLTSQGNPQYDWFYNDVKELNSMLLWPHIPRSLVDDEVLVSSLLSSHLITFKATHPEWLDFVTLIPQSAVQREVQEIRDNLVLTKSPATDALNSDNPSTEPAKTLTPALQKLLDSESGTYYGRCYRHRSSEEGMFVYFSKTKDQTDDMEGKAVIEEILMIWERGDILLLQADEEYKQVFQEVTVEGKEGLQIVTHSTIALDLLHVPVGPSVPAFALSKTSFQEPAEEVSAMLKATADLFLALPLRQLNKLVLSKYLMIMCGYFYDKEHALFLETHNPLVWRSISSQEEIEKDREKKKVEEMEEGEMEEGEEEENSKDEPKEDELKHKLTLVQEKLHREAKLFIPPACPLDILAVDCEMCSTSHGLELTRITAVHPTKGIVLDSLVKPAQSIVNYHTEFSGVTEAALQNITVNLEDIQIILMQYVDSRTILVGHSLDTDLRALQIIHRNIIDTAVLYLHPNGLPYKHALKKLAQDVLHIEIQDGDKGHDSVQDALVSLLLALVYAKEGVEVRQSSDRLYYQQPRQTMFEYICRASEKKGKKMQFHVLESENIIKNKYWEAHAMGYRKEGSAEYVAKAFEHKMSISPSLSANSIKCGCFNKVEKACKSVHINDSNEVKSITWLQIHLDDNSEKSLRDLDQSLESLYEQLPSNSAMIVLTQESLSELRQLIGKKIRNKWSNIRGQEVYIPLEKRSKDKKFSVNWNGIEDEAALLKAAQKAANGCLFINSK